MTPVKREAKKIASKTGLGWHQCLSQAKTALAQKKANAKTNKHR